MEAGTSSAQNAHWCRQRGIDRRMALNTPMAYEIKKKFHLFPTSSQKKGKKHSCNEGELDVAMSCGNVMFG